MLRALNVFISLFIFCSTIFISTLSSQEKKTGLPIPRFVSLRSEKANIRTGPGLRYPIEWVYQKRTMPLEIIAEFGTWRKVRDWENTIGWVHQSMLSGKRMVIIINSPQVIKNIAATHGSIIAEAEPGVIGKLIKCNSKSAWCQIQVDRYVGWLRRTQMWGVYPDELVD